MNSEARATHQACRGCRVRMASSGSAARHLAASAALRASASPRLSALQTHNKHDDDERRAPRDEDSARFGAAAGVAGIPERHAIKTRAERMQSHLDQLRDPRQVLLAQALSAAQQAQCVSTLEPSRMHELWRLEARAVLATRCFHHAAALDRARVFLLSPQRLDKADCVSFIAR